MKICFLSKKTINILLNKINNLFMKKTIILILSVVVLFSCSKKNNPKSQKSKKPPLLTLKTNDKTTTFDFSVDTTIVLGKMEFHLSKKDGKGIVKAYEVGTITTHRNSLSGTVYKIDNTLYIYDGSAIQECVSIDCIPSDASSVYVLLGSEVSSGFCVGDDPDGELRLVARLSSGEVALTGEFTFETPVAGVTNQDHLDCWIEFDPMEVVKKI
jgi:hypothetical protein